MFYKVLNFSLVIPLIFILFYEFELLFEHLKKCNSPNIIQSAFLLFSATILVTKYVNVYQLRGIGSKRENTKITRVLKINYMCFIFLTLVDKW